MATDTEYKKLILEKDGLIKVSMMVESKPEDRQICNAAARFMTRMLSA